MDLAAGAAGAVAGLLLHGKAKLVKVASGSGGGDSGGLGGALLNAAASMVGLGASDPETEMSFMFNPTGYQIEQTIHLEKSLDKTEAGGNFEYMGTSMMRVTMELFFDDFASAKGDVTPKINKLLQWQQPVGDDPPPFVKFDWGNKTQLGNFQGVITSLTINYTVFAKDGTPLQAKVNLTLEGPTKLKPGGNPTSHAIDMRRVHTVIEGETIQSVAYVELGDPNYWRAIAAANDIDDPLRVRPGAALVIPSAADAARMA